MRPLWSSLIIHNHRLIDTHTYGLSILLLHHFVFQPGNPSFSINAKYLKYYLIILDFPELGWLVALVESN
jgi:hypothetical protein